MNPYAQQPTLPPCPECGGRRVGTRCGQRMMLIRQGETWQHDITSFRALVCITCGYTNLYADNLSKLNQEVENHPEDFEL